MLNKIDEQGWEASVEDMRARRPITGILRYTFDWGASDDSDAKNNTKGDINAVSGVIVQWSKLISHHAQKV